MQFFLLFLIIFYSYIPLYSQSFRAYYNNNFTTERYVYSLDTLDLTLPPTNEQSTISRGDEYPLCAVPKEKCRFCVLLNSDPYDDAINLIIKRVCHQDTNEPAFAIIASLKPAQPHLVVLVPYQHTPTTSNIDDKTWLLMGQYINILQYLLEQEPFNHTSFTIGCNTGPSESSGASIPCHAHCQIMPRQSLQEEQNYLKARDLRKTIYEDQMLFTQLLSEKLDLFVSASPRKIFIQNHKLTNTDCYLCQFIHDDKKYQQENLIIQQTMHYTLAYALEPQTPGHLMIIPHNHARSSQELNQLVWAELLDLTRTAQFILRTQCNARSTNIVIAVGEHAGATNHFYIEVIGDYGPSHKSFINKGRGKTNLLLVDPQEFCVRVKDALREIAHL